MPDPRAVNGDVLGQGITATNGDRDNLALYTELALPLTRQLEGQLALRYDDYSDFGTATTPKVGLKFKAAPELLLRATGAAVSARRRCRRSRRPWRRSSCRSTTR
jgi:iron complex outermembrane recepter protein